MQAHGIQGMVLAIIKVLLRKSILTKIYISTFKTFIKILYESAMIRNEIMNFISNSFSNLTQVPFIYYDDEQ